MIAPLLLWDKIISRPSAIKLSKLNDPSQWIGKCIKVFKFRIEWNIWIFLVSATQSVTQWPVPTKLKYHFQVSIFCNLSNQVLDLSEKLLHQIGLSFMAEGEVPLLSLTNVPING